MQRLNRDVYVAIALLLICGVFFWASFEIRTPDYGALSPAAWPQVIIGVLTVLSIIYLVQSIKHGPDADDDEDRDERPKPTNLREWIVYWRNVFWCFALFFLYLSGIPYLGMLVSGVAFVFLLQCALGGISPRKLALHAFIAILAVGGMWSLFTYALEVQLPRGSLSGLF
jgi:putative tricarboxylic transport membrane protein